MHNGIGRNDIVNHQEVFYYMKYRWNAFNSWRKSTSILRKGIFQP